MKQNSQSSKKSTKGRKSQRSGSSNHQQGQAKMNRQAKVQVHVPVSYGSVSQRSTPKIQQKGTEVIIHHREFLTTINRSTSAFAVQNTFVLNPSNSTTFPWASPIASRYESYVFEKIELEFLTESPTSQGGFLLMAVDYNNDDPAPTTKQQALQYESVKSGPVWQNMKVNLMKKDLQKRKSYLCNNGIGVVPTEIGLYNTGNLFICAGGNSDANVAGDLFIDYTIRFMTPEFNTLPGQAILSPMSSINEEGHPFATVSVADTAIIGRPIASYLTQTFPNSPVFTAVKDFKFIADMVANGAGLGGVTHTLTPTSNWLGNTSGLSNLTNLTTVLD